MKRNIPKRPRPTSNWARNAPARTRSVIKRSGSNGDVMRDWMKKKTARRNAPSSKNGQALVEPQPFVDA